MTCYQIGYVVAGFGALAHVYFAYLETLKWGPATVHDIAPSWIGGLSEAEAAGVIAWAKRLAFNIGVYNLVLALGLAWTCRTFYVQAPTAKSLGIFFAVWLIGAAAAALYTHVTKAFIAQGVLGVLLIIAAICI